MSTITSPRPSAPQSTSLSSSPTASRTSSPAPLTRRANRLALRDYYNLKPASPTSTTSPTSSTTTSSNAPPHSPPVTKISPLDDPSFDPNAYIASILSTSSLTDVLKIEANLINEIKGLDGERKALVYDNYSKLITATDTIRRMRANMDPLGPETRVGMGKGTFGANVGGIAEMAGELVGKRRVEMGEGVEEQRGRAERKRREKDTVRWVLGTPKRLEELIGKGDRDAAGRDWDEIRGWMQRKKGVGGVEELRQECERIMEKG